MRKGEWGIDSTTYSDAQLLALLRRDMNEGAAALLEAYSGLVWQVCARRLRNPEDIKECVNITFADFCVSFHRFDADRGSLRSFLCTIADRRALERYRKICAVNRAEEKFRNLACTADQEAHAREALDRAELTQSLELLEAVDARVLRMKYYSGMTFREIAAKLQLPYETVKKRSQRSLRKLKQKISE